MSGIFSALGSLFGKGGALAPIGTGFGALRDAGTSWAEGGFGMIPKAGGSQNAPPGGGGGMGMGQGGTFATGLLGRVGSALFGGQNKALENQAKAYKTAYEGSVPFYDQARGRFNPYAEQGLAANPLISSLLGMSEGDSSGGEGLARFRESTGYQDTLNQSLRGVGANAAARGLMGSSGSGRAFQETAGRLAQSSFGDYFDRLLGQQQVGYNAAGALGELDLGQGLAKQQALFGEHSTRGKKKSSFLSKLFG
jgi:hypothetical protein